MAKYIVRDNQGNLVTVGAEGFVPEGAICEAPIEQYENSDLSLVNGVVIVDQAKKAMRLQAEAQEKINLQSLSFLASTDWYVVRFSETGAPIPDDVKEKRQAARASIKA